ncbi:MAG: hypothetical protein ACR2HH_16080 [Chthoniobacterales bacterium]
MSQRFWEYFKGIELLELDSNSVVLDIGGGSPRTGLGFFSSLLATAARRVIVMDPNIGEGHIIPQNVEVLRAYSTYDSLRDTFNRFPEITHIACISVFEHIEPEIRHGIVRAINEFFLGSHFVTTFEYHPLRSFFEHQLTAQTLSEMMAPLTSFYPTAFEASPVLAEDPRFPPPSDGPLRIVVRRFLRRVVGLVPKWYPVAVAFQRSTA